MAKTERSGHTTTDHDFIRRWVEERGGWPARVGGTGSGDDPGILRIDFPGYSGGDSLERMEWEEWFEKFDENELAFLHRDMSHGGDDLDRFNKLVSRGSGDSGGSGSRSTRSSSGSKSTASRSSSSKSGGSKSSSKSGGSKSTGSSSSSKSGGSKTASSRASSSGSKSGGSKSGGSKSSGSKSGGSKSSGSKSGGSKSSSKSGGSTSSSSKSSGGGTTASKSAGKSAGKSASKAGGLLRGAVAALRGGDGGGDGAEEMRELLKHELGDLFFAERVFLKGTKTLAKEAQDPMVKERLEEHVRETEGQIERLQEAFRAIGERAKAEKCEAALGLQEEHDSFKSEEKPSKMLLSAFDLGSGLRVEHYEIAGYRSAIAVATALGERECAALLKENLQEELAMAAFLEKNSLAVLRAMAKA